MARLKIQGPPRTTGTTGRVDRIAPSSVFREEGVDPRSMKGMFRNDIPFQALKGQLVNAFQESNRSASAAANPGAYYMAVGRTGSAFINFIDAASSLEDFELDFIMPEVEAMAQVYSRRTAEPMDTSLEVIKGVVYEHLQNTKNDPPALHRVLGGGRLASNMAMWTQDAEDAAKAHREAVREAEFEEQRVKKIHYARMAPEFEERRLLKRLKQQAWREGQGR